MPRRFLAIALLAGLAMTARAELATLHDLTLRSLTTPDLHRLERYAGKPVLLFFFQPDCNWCYRQFRVINKLSAACQDDFQAIGVGVNGDRRTLKQELRRYMPRFPTYEASAELLELIGGEPPTPFSLLGDGGGAPVSWGRGFLPAPELVQFLGEASGPVCAGDAEPGRAP